MVAFNIRFELKKAIFQMTAAEVSWALYNNRFSVVR
jgi:hypothetical protein